MFPITMEEQDGWLPSSQGHWPVSKQMHFLWPGVRTEDFLAVWARKGGNRLDPMIVLHNPREASHPVGLGDLAGDCSHLTPEAP